MAAEQRGASWPYPLPVIISWPINPFPSPIQPFKAAIADLPGSASKIIARALLDNDITPHLGASVQRLTRDGVIGEKGDIIPARHIFVVTSARQPDWVKGLAIAHCEDGYIQVRPTLQLMEYDNVFAAGDIASVCGEKREKAGVFAVRAGPYLADNIRCFIQALPLKFFRPQSRYLALIGLGGKQALAIRGRFVAKGALWWHLKNWIDKKFIEKFTQIPEMKIPAAPLPALARTLDDPMETDGFECSGCGAKAGADILSEALAAASQMARGKGASPRYLPPSGITRDHGTIHLPRDIPQKVSLSQSVDFLSQHISDALSLWPDNSSSCLERYICGRRQAPCRTGISYCATRARRNAEIRP